MWLKVKQCFRLNFEIQSKDYRKITQVETLTALKTKKIFSVDFSLYVHYTFRKYELF